MSKNFELLTQLGEQFNLYPPQAAVAEPPRLMAAPAARSSHMAGTLQGTASAEEITLVQRVFLAAGPAAPKTVVFCGVDLGDDPNSLCARCGEILATRGSGDVCVVDANLHAPSLHKRYGFENRLGFSDVILEPQDAKSLAQQVGGGPLWLLPAGSRAADGHAILSRDRLQDRISELREQFRYLLISAPPANLYPDALLLGQLADGVVLVLKASSTRRATALKVKENLEASSVRLLGAILIDRAFPIPEALYRKL